MHRPSYIFVIILILFAYGCECGFFSGCPPSSASLINEYFIQASKTKDRTIEYLWIGGKGCFQVFGTLDCPSKCRNEIIQAAKPWNGCYMDIEYEDNLQISDCNPFDFKNLFERMNYNQSDPPKWYPSTYQGTWTIHEVEVEPPQDDDHFHSCTLYYHENSGHLYFFVSKGRYP
jgi:hypothetical protein